MTSDTTVGQLAASFDRFARRECAGVSPLYQALARQIAKSPALLTLAAQAGAGQPVPNLLLASVHFLLLKAPRRPALAAFYGSLADRPAPPEDAFPAFEDFCRNHGPDIATLLRQRVVSTNEVQRCACLLPAFAAIAHESVEPLQMIEVGSSAGLNLLWDRFGYDYGSAGRLEPDDAKLVLHCVLRHTKSLPLPPHMPVVDQRMGIDPLPLDPADPEDALWLRALIWPEQRARAKRLETALALARDLRPAVRCGDGTLLLEAVAGELPAKGTLCVYHSFMRNQMKPSARAAFAAAMARIGRSRPLYQVALEWGESAAPELLLTRHHEGAAEAQLLALCDAHGAWLDWRAAFPSNAPQRP